MRGMIVRTKSIRISAILGALLCLLDIPAYGVGVDAALEEGDAGNVAAAAAQSEIEQVADEADRLFTDYRRTLQEIDSLRVYNEQLEDVVVSQKGEIVDLRSQISDIDNVERKLGPLMSKMIDVLGRFVELDVPFLPEERAQRMNELRDLMKRSDVSLSEKYRRLMEAYQVENEYGRTIETYKGRLETDGSGRTVDFLRVGRVALVYQTVDMEESGRWDPETRSWVVLGDDFRRSIRAGIRMANKLTAPDLLKVPVAAPETVQ